MKTLDTIRHRRAVRDYKPEPVTPSLLRQLIWAASWAPSDMNEQPCHFTIVTDAALLDEISARSKSRALDDVATMPRPGHFRDLLKDPHFHIFYHAPALVVISAPADGHWTAANCALAAQNLMLAALELGLGSCWIGFAQGWLNTEDGHQLLGLPRHSQVIAPIIVGHPKAIPPPTPRKTPVITWIGDWRLPGQGTDPASDPQPQETP